MISAREFTHFVGNSAEGLGLRSYIYIISMLGLHIYPREYTPKVSTSFSQKLWQLYIVFQGRAQLEHSRHIVNVSVEATCWHFNPWCILKKTTKLVGPFATMLQEPRHSEKGAKPDCVIQLKVSAHPCEL